ncbi:uncharacterized mitochondrial protein AtMg00310-like [Rosa chinensis]|uniref:uncharacterized mitochondrial protein AtMg00310-like n=1 Tax=Rosa chinensis TaxID=74649 RepID=UPI000D094AEC|nr:uncharacterized mitochondrial protein AtMg00310-like [Rosa chinensis]
MSDASVHNLCDILGVPATINPGCYLGLPTIWGRSKKDSLSFIKAKLADKIQNWKLFTLSMAGRETLIKYVAQTVPTFPMHCFKFPTTPCKELDAMMANFWWGQKKDENKIYWRSWDFLGQPKDRGGLGFRNLSEFNTLVLAKQVWRLHSNPTSFCAQILKEIYYPYSDILNAGKGSRASWAWSSLLDGKNIIVDEARWQVGNGELINIWVDKWISCSTHGFLLPLLPVNSSRPHMVKELIDWDTRSWKLDRISDLISEEDLLDIELIALVTDL